MHSLNAHVQMSSGARCLIFGRTFCLLPSFMCANSEGSGEAARMSYIGNGIGRGFAEVQILKKVKINS